MMETSEEIDRRLEAERNTLIADATAKAREAYDREPYLASGGGALSMEWQYQLTDRAAPFDTRHQALAVISRLGVTFATEDAEHAVEQLGLIMVHAAVIATIEHLAVDPIITLGRELTKRQDVQPMRAAAGLATAALGTRREPRRLALVDGLALAIAKALDDCEIGHGLTIEPLELYRHIAGEVIAGKLSMQTAGEPHPRARPAPTGVRTAELPPSPSERRTTALQQLQAAADVLEADVNVPVADIHRAARLQVDTGRETITVTGPPDADPDVLGRIMERQLAHAEQRAAEGDEFMSTVATDGFAAAITKHKAPVEPGAITGIVEVPPRHAGTMGMRAAMAAWRNGPPPGVPAISHFEAINAREVAPGIVAADLPPGATAVVGHVEITLPKADQTSEDAAFIAPATAEERRLGVSAATVCPQCAAPMSPGVTAATSDPDGTVYRCSNGHEVTKATLVALAAQHIRQGAAEQLAKPYRQVMEEQAAIAKDNEPARVRAAGQRLAAQAAALSPDTKIEGQAPVARSGRHFPPPRRP